MLWQCRKHLDLLEHGEKRSGYQFDEELATRPVNFFAKRLTFVEGERAGEPFALEPWQQFCLGYIFGWLRADGFRLVREAWLRMARGNGKSPLAAGVGLYCTGWDGFYGLDGKWHSEQRSQVFTAATKREQTRAVMDTAALLVERSPYLRERLELLGGKFINRIVDHETASFFKSLGRDSHTEDSWNPQLAIFDEVHAYGSDGMWNVFASAMVKRRQALIFAITTAGFGGPLSFGMSKDAYYRRLIDPDSGQTNDRVFAYIAEHDPKINCPACRGGKKVGDRDCPRCKGRGFSGDDPLADERCWHKSNPNLGVSVQVDGLRARVEDAKLDKKLEPDVRVKNFDEWQLSGERAIGEEAWDACGRACPMPSDAELRQRACFAGLDLASTRDLNALVLYWPPAGKWKTAAARWWYWIPEASIEERKKRDGLDYQPWVEAGLVATTPGLFIDQDYIEKKLEELGGLFTIRKVGADRKFGEGLLPRLEKKGFAVERISQSFANLCVPWQTIEKMVGNCTLAHGGNPVTREHAKSVVLVKDADGLKIVSKGATEQNIDGMAALQNGVYLALKEPPDAPPAPPTHAKLPAHRGGGRRQSLNFGKSRA